MDVGFHRYGGELAHKSLNLGNTYPIPAFIREAVFCGLAGFVLSSCRDLNRVQSSVHSPVVFYPFKRGQ